ncbi:hypothetical protein MLD38_031235 [Melastoma candidum]|uniref:Uncharacterized protein n=1 Tax=Melastoma candidum TaxID=119954 RepID=A0ACB9MQC0_9MYRT|nr:hypothetical protein MLD38_031235 [Melastoma candidum]
MDKGDISQTVNEQVRKAVPSAEKSEKSYIQDRGTTKTQISPSFPSEHAQTLPRGFGGLDTNDFNTTPIGMNDAYEKTVEEVKDHMIIQEEGKPACMEYLIKWKGLPESEISWEPIESLWQLKD